MSADAHAEWAVQFEAETIVALELLAIDALGRLDTDQLRGLLWVGLLDEGFSRVLEEMRMRGIDL